jgi:hypothetical protein
MRRGAHLIVIFLAAVLAVGDLAAQGSRPDPWGPGVVSPPPPMPTHRSSPVIFGPAIELRGAPALRHITPGGPATTPVMRDPTPVYCLQVPFADPEQQWASCRADPVCGVCPDGRPWGSGRPDRR